MLTIEIKAEIWKINFKRSKFNVIIEKKVNSIHYSAKLYNGNKLFTLFVD